MRRFGIVILPALLALALIAAALIWRAGDALPGLGRVFGEGTPDIGGPFLLVDQDGHRRASRDFAGRYMLIYFGYTYCPDVCPVTLTLMGDALQKLGPKAQRIAPIFITVDPARDTPAQLKAYLRNFDPRFIGLTGDPTSIAKAAAAYRVYFRKQPVAGGTYGMDHTSVIYLMGPDGKFIAYWDDTSVGPDKLAGEIAAKL